MLQALDVPAEAYLACHDDYYRKVREGGHYLLEKASECGAMDWPIEGLLSLSSFDICIVRNVRSAYILWAQGCFEREHFFSNFFKLSKSKSSESAVNSEWFR